MAYVFTVSLSHKLSLCLVLAFIVPTCGDIMPGACLVARTAFINMGCVDSPRLMCRALAVFFRMEMAGKEMCSVHPCFDYDQPSGRHCTPVLNCYVIQVIPLGICKQGDVCCRDTPSITTQERSTFNSDLN